MQLSWYYNIASWNGGCSPCSCWFHFPYKCWDLLHPQKKKRNVEQIPGKKKQREKNQHVPLAVRITSVMYPAFTWREKFYKMLLSNMQKRFRIRFQTNIFPSSCFNLKADCPASLVYKALGIRLLIQTPASHHLPIPCCQRFAFICMILRCAYPLFRLYNDAKETPPHAAPLHRPLKATHLWNEKGKTDSSFFFLSVLIINR